MNILNQLRKKLFIHFNYSKFNFNSTRVNAYLYRPTEILHATKFSYDPRFSYFLLCASYGDKWLILSFLHALFFYHDSVKIIASEEDRELVRIFVGSSKLNRYFIFEDSEKVKAISQCISPISGTSSQLICDHTKLVQVDSVCKFGFPKNEIRHLHIVKYPYFSDLHICHGVSYATLLKMLLYLPADSTAATPQYYNKSDYKNVNDILYFNEIKACNFKHCILFNIINISHQPLSQSQLLRFLKEFERNNIFVFLNIAGANDFSFYTSVASQTNLCQIVDIPAHLLALISNKVNGVFGVMGGAMSVAAHFSNAQVLSLYTPAIGVKFDIRLLHGGAYYDNIWKLNIRDWPGLGSERSVENVFIEDVTALHDKKIATIVQKFSRSL